MVLILSKNTLYMKRKYVDVLSNFGIEDVGLVGGKNASLGEMIRNLSRQGIRVPSGFAVTTAGYDKFIAFNDLHDKIDNLLFTIDIDNLVSLQRTGIKIRQLIKDGEFPSDIQKSILDHYNNLSKQFTDVDGNPQEITDVAVRSSSTAEDLPDASFAGQQETYLNVRGKNQVLESIKNCFASLYTDRAITYRKTIGYDEQLSISVCVQKMVRSDLGSAGVAFSLDTESGFKDVILINGNWGLGESVVSGSVKPDEFIVYKNKLNEGYKAIIDKKIGDKTHMSVYGSNPDEKIKTRMVSDIKKSLFCLNEDMILKLSNWVVEIERYYSKIYKSPSPVDVEWAVDGLSEELFIVQARPETVHSNRDKVFTEYEIEKSSNSKVLTTGIAVGDRIAKGCVQIIHTLDTRNPHKNVLDFKDGDILVTDITDPDWEPIMRKAGAIITNRGGRTCHSAIISREMGICAIVGTGNGTEILKNGQMITSSCAEGEIGYVYDGELKWVENKINLSRLPKINTKILFNLACPTKVFKYADYPVSGVGLVRQEFVINNFIKCHPSALINYDKLNYDRLNDDLKNQIDTLTVGFDSPTSYYIDKLSYGIGRIAAAFYPKPIIVRFSDFKSNEYRNLLCGHIYEPEEENPMIGWRGASRYYSPEFKEAFGLECLAIKKIREEMGFDNVIVMIPFCRTVEELRKVKAVMAEYGLVQGENGLKIYIMCEIPSNVLLADEFCKHVDGFSIGSNDLTQLTLGLDRDSSLVAHLYDERNPAVQQMLSNVIKKCKNNDVKIGICGQGPSDYPEFAQFLVKEGIDTISITPDAFVKTVQAIYEIENSL